MNEDQKQELISRLKRNKGEMKIMENENLKKGK